MPADQYACTEAALAAVPEAAVVANLGVASWVLMAVADRDRNLYLRGGMGATTATGVGLSLATDGPVIVLEGDGSLLMSLGSLATVGEYAPSTLTVVVWNNGTYQTTGGQRTTPVDFAAVADACGVAGFAADTNETFEAALADARSTDRPSLVDCSVEPADAAPHPSYDYAHAHLTHRFRSAVRED